MDDTVLRTDPTNPQKRLFEPDPGDLRPEARDHPYLKYELMNKILTNVTNRSNVFAVWVTVGFFEVLSDSNGSGPQLLGQEIGRGENRHIRHRMFAIVDRTNLTIGQANPGQPGRRPFFIDGRTGATISSLSRREEALYNAQNETPALSTYFELMDRIVPDFLGTLSTQKIKGTRVLLK